MDQCLDNKRPCEDREKDCGCIYDILRKILMLQKQDYDNENYAGCDKPYLGPVCNSICYNTRPIQLYNCCSGNTWTFPYTINGTTNTSNVFRIEALENCCCTCRILYFDTVTNNYVSTNEFFTLDLKCVGAIKCLADTFVELC